MKTDINLADFKNKATKALAANKKLLADLKKKKPDNLDKMFEEAHEQAFEEIDCLTCANCCKTISPIFKVRDIERLAKHFRLTFNDFVAQYLHIDEEKDYVLNVAPCPFLGADNYCSVYEQRPDACREYPHTDSRKMHRLLTLTEKNSLVCPAVYRVLELIRLPNKK